MTAKCIALFGSSFNPPHAGHLAVLRELADRNLFDEIWLVPVWKHPFEKELAPFTNRSEMARLLVEECGNPSPRRDGGKGSKTKFQISTIEQELSRERSYMFDTVTELKKRHPEFEFTLIVGSDVKDELTKWHRADELRELVKFHFVPRRGYEDSPYPEVSSSELRGKIKLGEDISGLTTRKIADYIKRNRLYLHV